MLRTNPSLVTYHILCMALKHNPPSSVVEYMLQLNPKAAGVPKSGPTPLQVAVQNSCSILVVEHLIQACPLALVATNPGSHLDPLSYAKRFRAEEKDLIKVLSTPLSHWIPPKDDTAYLKEEDDSSDDSSDESGDSEKTAAAGNVNAVEGNQYKQASSQPAPKVRFSGLSPPAFDLCVGPTPIPSSTPVSSMPAQQQQRRPAQTFPRTAPTTAAGSRTTNYGSNEQQNYGPRVTNAVHIPPQVVPSPPYPSNQHRQQQISAHQDRQELINVKHLCLAVVKGHKRLSRDLKALAVATERNHDAASVASETSLFARMTEQNDKQFRTHLIALDMKEKAMRAHLRQVEDRLTAKFKNDTAQVLATVTAAVEKIQAASAINARALPTSTGADRNVNEKELGLVQDRMKQLTSLVQDRLRHLQGRVQGVEDALTNQIEQLESHYEHELCQRYMPTTDSNSFYFEAKFPDASKSAEGQATTAPSSSAPSSTSRARIVDIERRFGPPQRRQQQQQVSPNTVSTSYTSSSASISSSASWSDRRGDGSSGDGPPNPIVFRTPTGIGRHGDDFDDDVRSLLSEDELVLVKDQQRARRNWLMLVRCPRPLRNNVTTGCFPQTDE